MSELPSTCVQKENRKRLGGANVVMEPRSGATAAPWKRLKPAGTQGTAAHDDKNNDSGIASGSSIQSSPSNSDRSVGSIDLSPLPSPTGTQNASFCREATSPAQSANLGATPSTSQQQQIAGPSNAGATVAAGEPSPSTSGEPRVDSRGRVKPTKCKQCGFVASTKDEFYSHLKNTHIRPEKLLDCKLCNFVTEYKHHLEYHLKNHTGERPFKCDKCSYTCVNKSMLNSHKKSHSDVYQYRCLDCAYCTKYCHSLKVHLRKYSHRPSLVLNPDGTPNSNSVIDVYGTRRGPRNSSTPANRQPPQPTQAIRFEDVPSTSRQADLLQMAMSQEQRTPFPHPLLHQYPVMLQSQLLLTHLAAMQQQLLVSPPSSVTEEPVPSTSATPSGDECVLDLSRNAERSDDDYEEQFSSDEENNNCPSPGPGYCYECRHCLISFRDIVLYSIHMGYHGFNNPFACSRCGHVSDNRLDFYVHLTRTSHK